MYFADSPTKEIRMYKYDGDTGTVSDPALVARVDMGFPDGSCIDSEGFIWNAVWRSGAGPSMVNRIDPKSGKVVFTVRMPDTTSQVSCCCFGGPKLDVLFITTAREGMNEEKEPNAGGIYAVKVPFMGLKESRFGGN